MKKMVVVLAFMVLLTCVDGLVSSFAQDKTKDIRAWLASLAKLPFKVYENLSRVRSGTEPRVGTRVMLFDISTQQERLLWECGACWSPMAVDGDRIAVVTPKGIDVFLLSTKRHSASIKNDDAAGVATVEILQAVTPDRLLIAVRKARDSTCAIQLKFADLKSGTIVNTDAPNECLGILAGYMKPAWLLTNRIIGNTNQAVSRLIEWPYEPLSPSGRGAGRVLSPKLENDPISRFDAVWFGNNQVIYLQTL